MGKNEKLNMISHKYLFITLLIYTVTVPVFEQYIGPIGNILVNGVAILFCLSFIIVIPDKIYNKLHENVKIRIYLYFIIFYFIIISLASMSGIFFSNVNPIFRDIFEFHKPVLYLSIVIFTYYIMLQNKNYQIMQMTLNIVFVLIVVISIFQLEGNRDITLLYTANNIFESKRLSIPFGNPYDYAFVMIFFCFYYFFKYASGNLKYIIPLFIALFLLLATGSRSVFLSLLIVVIFFIPLILIFSKFSRKTKFYFFIQIFTFFFLIYFYLDFDKFYQNYIFLLEQFVQLYESNEIGDSAEARLKQFIYTYQRALSHPMLLLFGNGPAKSVVDFNESGLILYMEHVESAVTYLLYRYGLLGILCFTLIYLSALIITVQNNFILPLGKGLYSLNLAIMCWLISVPFSSLGGMYIEQPKVSILFYVLISYSFAVNYVFINKKLQI